VIELLDDQYDEHRSVGRDVEGAASPFAWLRKLVADVLAALQRLE
jgi:hypothetical protein